LSVYSIIDSFRPYTQKIWQNFSDDQKQQFIRHLKGFWDKARHRLPNSQHKIIEDMLSCSKLIAYKGKIDSVNINGNDAFVTLICNEKFTIHVKRIINCLSPEANITRQGNQLLNKLVEKGMIKQGPCNLGIKVDAENGFVESENLNVTSGLYVIGSNLKGVLWESTAVPELRDQAKRIADNIIKKYNNAIETPETNYLDRNGLLN
jgi:uncharacterized NAD(P)/FAD-binding protein YdhS